MRQEWRLEAPALPTCGSSCHEGLPSHALYRDGFEMNGFSKKRKIWIDLDNSPHVPFFVPILKELENRGHTIILTTRDRFQVCGLADYYKLNYTRIGKHHGANKLVKLGGLIWRTFQLAPFVRKERPDISLSHGSRSLILLSSLFNIPTILLFDYEYARMFPFIKPVIGIAPEVINDPEIVKHFKWGLRTYRGLKEDVYVSSFRPDTSILGKLNLKETDMIATIRPPATEAHYHNPESEKLFDEVVTFLGSNSEVRIIMLPRNHSQKQHICTTWSTWCDEGRIVIPDQVFNGLDLIWHSDFVVSGGGTMNREAAALGVPVYSIFRGKIGAVDRYLAETGRLILLATIEDVKSRIQLARRAKGSEINVGERMVLKQIMAAIEEIIAKSFPASVECV